MLGGPVFRKVGIHDADSMVAACVPADFSAAILAEFAPGADVRAAAASLAALGADLRTLFTALAVCA